MKLLFNLENNILPVNRRNNSLQPSKLTRNLKLSRITQPTTELELAVTEKFVGLNLHPFPTSTQINYRRSPSLFWNKYHLNSKDNYPFDHQWGRKCFHNISYGAKN